MPFAARGHAISRSDGHPHLHVSTAFESHIEHETIESAGLDESKHAVCPDRFLLVSLFMTLADFVVCLLG